VEGGFVGDLYEFTIYSHALSDQEIQNNYKDFLEDKVLGVDSADTILQYNSQSTLKKLTKRKRHPLCCLSDTSGNGWTGELETKKE